VSRVEQWPVASADLVAYVVYLDANRANLLWQALRGDAMAAYVEANRDDLPPASTP
jgi:hypothetical protein